MGANFHDVMCLIGFILFIFSGLVGLKILLDMDSKNRGDDDK